MALKILHITFSDSGGAGTAALRLHRGLMNIGVESKILVLQRMSAADEVYEYPKPNKYFILFLRVLKKLRLPQTLEHKNDNLYKSFKGNFEYFSFARTSFIELPEHPLVKECDIVNLHWIPNFVDYFTFFQHVTKPIVWTQHDMSAFQGGFHYKEDMLRNLHLKNIDREQYHYKLSSIEKMPQNKMVIVSPSKWLLNEAQQSEILGRFQHFHIPNGLDNTIFNFKEQSRLKNKLELSENKLTVLFISETVKSIRKGFKHILELIEDEEILSRFEFVAVGNIRASQKSNNVKYLGSIHSENTISEVYSAADIYLLPSREDNLPNVMLESLCAGTPVVGFNIGGIKDLVKNGQNGFLSNNLSTESLKLALLKCADNLTLFDRKAIARENGSRYNANNQATCYKEVYMELKKITE